MAKWLREERVSTESALTIFSGFHKRFPEATIDDFHSALTTALGPTEGSAESTKGPTQDLKVKDKPPPKRAKRPKKAKPK